MNTFFAASLFGALCTASVASHAVEHCFDFSRMPVGTVYQVGDEYVDALLRVEMRDFFVDGVAVARAPGIKVVSIENTAQALGTAPEVHTYLMNARVIPNVPVRKVTMKIAQNVGEYDKTHFNIGVNGELRHIVGALTPLDNQLMGDTGGTARVRVTLTADPDPSDWHRGTLSLTAESGLIHKFGFGGQILNVDDVCLEW